MPVLSSVAPTIGYNLVQGMLNAISARPAGPLVDTPLLKLFTAGPLPIVPLSVLPDFTICTFQGYADVTPTFGAPVNLPSALGQGVIASHTFICTGSLTPENVVGYGIFDGSDNLVIAEYFDAPVPINNAGDFIDLQVILPVGYKTTI